MGGCGSQPASMQRTPSQSSQQQREEAGNGHRLRIRMLQSFAHAMAQQKQLFSLLNSGVGTDRWIRVDK